MKSNDCKLFGCVNIVSFIVSVDTTMSSMNVKKKLQADFVSVDTTMSSMNVEVVKHLQAVHGRSYNHMGKISP